MAKKIFTIIAIVAGLGAIVWLWMWQGKPKELPPTEETMRPSDEGTTPGTGASALPFDIVTYEHADPAFRISYPSIYLLKTSDVSIGIGTLPPLIAISSPDAERAGTNLVESSVIVGVSKEKDVISDCAEAGEGETFLGRIPIAGVPFEILTHEGAAAGNFYQTVRYRAVKDDACYEITLLMHSGNIGNYPAGSVQAFDQAATLERLKTILYSFQFGA